MAWYSFDRINSYNAFFHFILTNRGYGKSYGAKKRCIDRFLKYGEQFVYVRRYKTELKKIGKYFDDIKEAYPDHEFKVVGKTFYIDNHECGYAVPLSTSLTEKSTAYPKVCTIVFDEFIIDKGHIRYLDNEVEVMLELVLTITRKRDNARVYFLANNVSEVNPYFTYFNIKMNEGEKFKTFNDGTIVVEKNTDDIFMEEMKATKFGRLVKGTKYADYAIENKSLRDSDTFIEKLPLKNCIPIHCIAYKNERVQIWLDKKNNLYYCNEKIVSTNEIITLEADDHNENSILNAKTIKFTLLNDVIKSFQVGLVRFENQKVKHLMYDIFKTLGVK